MSLGWLSESSAWQKSSSKPIRGVSQGSVLGLKAVLFQQEELLKRTQNDPELRKIAAKEKIAKLAAFKRQIEKEREDYHQDVIRRDQRSEEIERRKAESQQRFAKDKHNLYDRFSREGNNDEYLVDFVQKQYDDEQIDIEKDSVEFFLSKLPKETMTRKRFFPEQDRLIAETDQLLESLENAEDAENELKQQMDSSSDEIWNRILQSELSRVINSQAIQNPASMTRVEQKLADEIQIELEAARKKFEKLLRKRSLSQ